MFGDIKVLVSDVDQVFPAPLDTQAAAAETRVAPESEASARQPKGVTYWTGAPGRRTSVQLVGPEMSRRFEAGEQAPSMRQEAHYLAEWLRNNHPQAVPMSEKTIYNRLGRVYRGLAHKFPK